MKIFGAPTRKSGPHSRPVPPSLDAGELFHEAFPVEIPMSESYAKAMDEFNQMRESLKRATAERDEASVQLQVQQRENARLIARVAEVEEQRDTYKKRVIEIEARFDDAAAIMMRVFDSRMTIKKGVEVDTQSMETAINNPPPDRDHLKS